MVWEFFIKLLLDFPLVLATTTNLALFFFKRHTKEETNTKAYETLGIKNTSIRFFFSLVVQDLFWRVFPLSDFLQLIVIIAPSWGTERKLGLEEMMSEIIS